MRILVANDDGIYSPGIAALARAAAEHGEVRVVAPDVEQSSAGHSVSSSRPLRYKSTPLFSGIEAYRVGGTPADCVALGVYHWGDVDVVLSGVNIGTNLGNAIWHSGTLAAAKQAVLLGVRGIALSTPVTGDEPDFEALEPHIDAILDELLPRDDLPLVNVNFPPQPRGTRWTRQAVSRYDGKIVADKDPYGRDIFWFVVEPIKDVEPGTDLWAIRESYISMTPLELDLTDHDALDRIGVAAGDLAGAPAG
jgi:5'-nucleotidase